MNNNIYKGRFIAELNIEAASRKEAEHLLLSLLEVLKRFIPGDLNYPQITLKKVNHV
jgi:uncharacterized protein (DUF2267 family)